jgi:hypothetical protein
MPKVRTDSEGLFESLTVEERYTKLKPNEFYGGGVHGQSVPTERRADRVLVRVTIEDGLAVEWTYWRVDVAGHPTYGSFTYWHFAPHYLPEAP